MAILISKVTYVLIEKQENDIIRISNKCFELFYDYINFGKSTKNDSIIFNETIVILKKRVKIYSLFESKIIMCLMKSKAGEKFSRIITFIDATESMNHLLHKRKSVSTMTMKTSK
ncbi:hypothetical protein RFI_37518 [Reticulomyxa filosa]|uniref:Uncharacterized protein n=1 Tax=Reticulomyxa filosa TaxID=46433 RepID=X6LGW1_RETFI|nr:hypothetical protein RFI_37518 [Reticulomyxa filosa]|eukprot:ETN99949.1 hypothetical protein RFI_37518 [Reticulomyxa filosa]